ncbi:MAG: terminase family protein [Candidatus Peribacteraceae bacterium]|nr:terminase family protein [Candidatus Peribacteraceae bacterium]
MEKIELDAWQKQVLKTKGNMCIVSPRQMGKSTVISQDAGEYAMNNSNKVIMIIASVERQALLLFEKVLSYIYLKNKSIICTKKEDKPTKHRLKLKNGSVIHCLPTGDSGYGIRGYTIDRLYADEAAFIGEDVWAAVTPMLATTGGDIILLSTPFGTDGYFYRAFHSKQFTSIRVDPERVIEDRLEPQKTNLLEFRADEKERMTKLQFLQEHMGEFVGGIQRFIPDSLIKLCCTIDPKNSNPPYGVLFQGIDIAREGGDETVLITLDRVNRKRLVQFDIEIPEGQKLTDTARLIIHKDKYLSHKKIYLDDGGLGVGVFDMLWEDPQTKRKVVGLNNASRDIEKLPSTRVGKVSKTKYKKKSLLGEDLAINLKVLMERGMIELFDDPRIRQSLRSMQCSYEDGKFKIFGNYTHIFEALKRAAYCLKDKSLNIYIY